MSLSDISKKWFAGDHPINAVAPSDTTEFAAANSNLVFTAQIAGVDYNGWSIVLKDPADVDQALSISSDSINKIIEISLATDAGSAIKTLASEVKDIIESDLKVSKIINIDYAANNDGTGVVEAFDGALIGGIDGTVCQDINVIVKDDQTGQLYVNILPNTRHDANWRLLDLTAF